MEKLKLANILSLRSELEAYIKMERLNGHRHAMSLKTV